MVVFRLGHHTGAEVDGLHHATRSEDTQHSVEVGIGWLHGSVQSVRERLAGCDVDGEAL